MRYKLVLILLCAASFLALKSTVTLSQSEQITPTGAVELLVPAGQFPMGDRKSVV